MRIDDPALDTLIRMYLDLEQRISQMLLTATIEGWERTRLEALYAQVQRELLSFNGYVDTWTRQMLSQEWQAGLDGGQALLDKLSDEHKVELPREIDGAAFTRLNTEALEVLAQDIVGRQETFLRGGLLRQARDYLRDLATGELARGIGLGKNPREIGRAIRDGSLTGLLDGRPLQQLSERIASTVGVTYSDGRVVSLHRYGEMSARTGMQRAFSEASAIKYQEYGVHLYKVSSHQSLCFICRPFENTVWALDDQGVAEGYDLCPRDIPLHPNCRHSRQPFIKGVSTGGKRMNDGLAMMSDKELYRHMRDRTDNGEQKMRWFRNGFRNEAEAKRLTAQGKEHGPNRREPGIEQRRMQATRRVLASGGKLTYAQSMSQVTGEMMRDEKRGIFAAQ